MANWLGVEPRHLSALVAVHETGSFRAAAAELGCAQSAVSQRVVQLEQLIGAELVERPRGRTTLQLSRAGLVLVKRAGQIIAELDAAMADLRAIAEQAMPTLRVGGYESVARALMPGALKRLAQTAPALRITLREAPDWSRFFPRVASGELDVAFADLPLAPGPFAFCELLRDPCTLLVHSESALAKRAEPPTLEEIGDLPLIGGSFPMQGLIIDHLRAAGIEPKFLYRSDLNAGTQSLVAEGLGAAFYPRLSMVEDPRVATVSLDGIVPARRIVVYWHRRRGQDQAIRHLVTALLAECEQREREQAVASGNADDEPGPDVADGAAA